jgi:hypothetical protein
MKFLSRIRSLLLDPGATPRSNWSHDYLGQTIWSDDEEAWSGEYNGTAFLLAYERDSETPPQEVVDYALTILTSEFELIPRLEDLKRESITKLPSRFHDELQALTLESIHFYRGTPECSAIACLKGGLDGRQWRFDMLGTELCNLNFDS